MTLLLGILLGYAVIIGVLGWVSAWGREDQIEELEAELAKWKQRATGNIRVVETLLDETAQLESVHTQTVEMLLNQ